METIEHQILVGNKSFAAIVKGQKIDGELHLDVDSLIEAQQKIAREQLVKAESFDLDLFNFCLNTCGLKVAELASKLETTQSNISQIRRGKKEPSKMFWKLFRIAMQSLIPGGKNTQTEIEKIINGAA